MKNTRLPLLASIFFATAVVICAVAPDKLPRPTWEDPVIDYFPDHAKAAKSPDAARAMIEDGKKLFEARFTVLDGAGRPGATGDAKPSTRTSQTDVGMTRVASPDATGCAGCHNQPVIGGSGDFVANVFVGANLRDPPLLSVDANEVDERNTISLFGSGAIEMLAREMTRDLLAHKTDAVKCAKQRQQDCRRDLVTKGVSFGYLTAKPDGSYDTSRVEGVDPDLIIKPFSAKGAFISLREFTINAMNQHHGMEADERFGEKFTGKKDFDGDGVEHELTIGHISAATLFQALLPASGTRQDPRLFPGKKIFGELGCASCHLPSIPLESRDYVEPGPYNKPGTLTDRDLPVIKIPLPYGPDTGVSLAKDGHLQVNAFTDLKRHKISDAADTFFGNEQMKQNGIPTDEFLSAKLWDLSTSSPYGHRGDCNTISEAIMHHSAEARASRDGFMALPDGQKKELINYLKSLGAIRKDLPAPVSKKPHPRPRRAA